MEARTVNRLEALALIVGPTVALAFFLLEPGGVLIDSVDSTDAEGKIEALTSYPILSHVVGLVVPLGLIVMLYGMAGINRAIVQEDTAAAVSRFGILCVTMGGFGWILAQGLSHVLAETDVDSAQALQASIALHRVDESITVISSLVISLGLMAFSLGLSARDSLGFHKIAALVITAVSVVSLVALVIGHSAPSEAMVSVGRACYFPWAIWCAILGVRFLKEGSLARNASSP